MNVYTCGGRQNHCVVAESMKKAAELYNAEYKVEPEELKLFSVYVIVQKDAN